MRRIFCFLFLAAALCFAHGQASAPSLTAADGAAWLSQRVATNFDNISGQPSASPWSTPWHFVFLFNSAQANSKSAYTDFAKTMIDDFLYERLKDNGAQKRPNLVSFYPYQLDLYRDSSKTIQAQSLNESTISRLDSIFPTVPFRFRADGVSVYPTTGGHDNLGPLEDVLHQVGPGDKPVPVVVVQFTDSSLSEQPHDSNDDVIRPPRSQQGVLDAGYLSWSEPARSFKVQSGSKSFDVHVHVFGPSTLRRLTTSVVSPQTQASETKSKVSSETLLVAGLVVLISIAGVLGARTFLRRVPPMSVTFGHGAPVVLNRGESVEVLGMNAKATGNKQHVTLNYPDAPQGVLFTVENQKMLEVKSVLWQVSKFGGSDGPVGLAEGENRLLCQDNLNSREILVTVRRVS